MTQPTDPTLDTLLDEVALRAELYGRYSRPTHLARAAVHAHVASAIRTAVEQERDKAQSDTRRWELFRNNVSMLARRIRKYQKYALLDDLVRLCEEHGAYANMLRARSTIPPQDRR